LQALGAIEAAYLQKDMKNVVVVKISNRERNDSQLLAVVDGFNWDEKIQYKVLLKSGKYKSPLHFIFFILKMKKKFYGDVCNFFMGEFRSEWMHDLKGALNPKFLYLLDDGAVSIVVQKKYIGQNIYNSYGIKSPEGLGGKIIKKIKGLLYYSFRRNHLQRIVPNLFTVYELEPIPGQKIIRNKFSYLKSKKINFDVVGDEVFYFGSTYSEANIVSLDYELRFIESIIGHYEKKAIRFVYIPHRDESSEKIELIKKEFNVQIKYLNVPAELYFFSSDKFPAHIGGGYTSVLLSLFEQHSFKSVTAFRLPENEIIEMYRKDVNEIYQFMSRYGISVEKVSV